MTDSIRKTDILRTIYKSQAGPSSSEIERSLKDIAVELKVSNDTNPKTVRAEEITNATGSPYLEDQPYYEKKVLYNSPSETEWKLVPTFEEQRKDVLAMKNMRKLNIIS